MRVVIVGPGRLGRSLAAYLSRSGPPPVLVGRGGAVPDADVVVLCVPDRAVAEVAGAVPVGPVVLHTAGALDLEPLATHPEHGSLHPLMTFPGPEVALPDPGTVPAAVAGTAAGRAAARALAARLGFHPFEVPGDRRLYHAAAVIAGNLATFLATEGAALLRAAGVDDAHARTVLVPLARASIDNSVHGLRTALTGPIARGDVGTLHGHAAAMRAAGLTEVAGTYAFLVEAATRARARDDEP